MGTAELQKEIKRLLGKLNWSQKRLGRELYYFKYEDDDEKEKQRYEENVKKHLSRESTKIEVLQNYIDLIAQHEESKKLDIIFPRYIRTSVLSARMEDGMKDISKLIGKLISE